MCNFVGKECNAYKTDGGLFVISGYKKDIHNIFSGLMFYIDEIEIKLKKFTINYSDRLFNVDDNDDIVDCCAVWSNKYDTFTIILLNEEKIKKIIKLIQIRKEILISNFIGDKKFGFKFQ